MRRDKDPRWGVGQETRLRGSSANPKGGPQCRATNKSSNPLGVYVCVGGGCNRDFFDRWRWMGERMGEGKLGWRLGGDDKPFCCWMDEWRREEEGGGGRERATQVSEKQASTHHHYHHHYHYHHHPQKAQKSNTDKRTEYSVVNPNSSSQSVSLPQGKKN